MSHWNRTYWEWDDKEDWRSQRRWHRHQRRGFNFVPLFLVLGGIMVLRHSFVASVVFFAIAVAKSIGWISHRTMGRAPTSGAMRDHSERGRGERSANPSEQKELDAIFAYATALEKTGSDTGLAKELREQALKLVRDRGDATLALRDLRAQLPPLKAAERDSFQARLRREVDFINAAEGEINGTAPPV